MAKTLQAVFAPQKFQPAVSQLSIEEFELRWQHNKPWVLANFSHISYFRTRQISVFLNALAATQIHHYDQQGAQGFLAIWPDKAILTFRGSQRFEHNILVNESESMRSHLLTLAKNALKGDLDITALRSLGNDVLADLKLVKTSFDNHSMVAVHHGFFTELNKLWPEILPALQYCRQRRLPVWVTGHSLGAAMATLAGMRYVFESVVTFGEPRVGSNIAHAFQAKQHLRYINGDDPVPRLPPERPLGYQHHGEIVAVTNANGRSYFQYDHSIIYYAENLLPFTHRPAAAR